MLKITAALALFCVFTETLATDLDGTPIGKTYWINGRDPSTPPVLFFSDRLYDTYDTPHSFVVVEASETPVLHYPAYKIRFDDGSEQYLEISNFKKALFNKQEYLSEGQGYLSIRQLIFEGPPTEVLAALDKERAAEARLAATRRAKAAAAAAAEARKREDAYEAHAAARMARGGVRIGMTREQVRQSSWGEPDHVNVTTTVHGQSEQWVYPENNFLHFSNGILVGIQNHDGGGYFVVAP